MDDGSGYVLGEDDGVDARTGNSDGDIPIALEVELIHEGKG